MGLEVAEKAQVPVETDTEVPKSKENGQLDQGPVHKEPLKFGSHVEEPIKGEENNASKANLPKDAVDEWPAPTQVHSFWFVRYRPYDDPKIKAKIDQADREIHNMNQLRFRILEDLKVKRADRVELAAQMRVLKSEGRQVKSIVDEKRKEMEPLQQALGKLRTPNNAGRSGGICSSEEELNDLIHSLQYRIQHESIPLSEEKQLLREIKQLESTREKVAANDAMRAKIQESLGQKDAIQDQVKLMGVDLDGVRKEQQALWSKINNLEAKVKVIDEDIKSVQEELNAVTEKRDKAFGTIQEWRKKRDEENASYYQYRQVLNKAKELAVHKNIKALEEFSEGEVEKFMTLWSNNKAIRDDYEKRILTSLDIRQLSRDGRIRNPDEKPLVAAEALVISEPETVSKANVKKPKEETKAPPKQEALPTEKVQKEASNKVTESKPPVEKTDTTADREIYMPEKPSPPEKKVDEALLKEMKREEEIAKAKQAMERKKKLAEKSASKAARRAQMEAEKKLKDREKKAKKKAATSATNEESENLTEGEEPDKAEVKEEEAPFEAPVPAKGKAYREKNAIKHRNRPRGPESLPKAILKRKKSTNYWAYAAPAAAVAAVAVLFILVLVYYYYLQ